MKTKKANILNLSVTNLKVKRAPVSVTKGKKEIDKSMILIHRPISY